MSDKTEPASKGGGSHFHFVPQARSLVGPVTHAGRIFTDEWTDIPMKQGLNGVPSLRAAYATPWQLSYQAAEAMRYWFLADLENQPGIETRIMRFHYEYNFIDKDCGAVETSTVTWTDIISKHRKPTP